MPFYGNFPYLVVLASFMFFLINNSAGDLIQDAPFTQDASVYINAIVCPRGIQNKAGGIVFLVHGTGTTGDASWEQAPYNERLASFGKGYDICWVNLPQKSLGDAQLAAEYVAYAIGYLAQRSPGSSQRINVIGHSQGSGMNIQWALTFWPSIRKSVINFISLAGPFKGTAIANPFCGVSQLIGGCAAAILQLEPNSKILAAQNSDRDSDSGAWALVPTTSIYSSTDEIVPNGIVRSFVRGANMIKIQSPSVCGLSHITDHFLFLVDEAVFNLATDAIAHDRPSDLRYFDSTTCDKQVETLINNIDQLPKVADDIGSLIVGVNRGKMIEDELLYNKVSVEPKLQPYVCQRGYALESDCQSFSGFQDA